MKTRNSSTRSTSQAPGSLLRGVKQSPWNPAPKGRQSSHKHNILVAPSASRSPMSTRKKNNSQVENIKENGISLCVSPIIKRRQVLGQRKLTDLINVCRDPSSRGQRSGNEKKAPLKIMKNCQENQAFPLEERMNMNNSEKGMEVKNGGKKQAVRKLSVVSDKENVLTTDMTEIPVRTSKRIKMATKSKDVLSTLKPATKKALNKKQNETKIVLETNLLNKEAVSSKTDKSQPDSQPKSKTPTGARSLRTCSSVAQLRNVTTRSGGKDVSDSTCDKIHVTTDQEPSDNEKENTGQNKDTTMPTRRWKRRLSHLDKDSIAKKANTGKVDVTPKLPDTSKRITRRISSAKLDKNNTLSGKLPKKSQNKESPGNSDSPEIQAKSKPPVWASVKGIKITPGKRKSFRINSDTYEFPISPHKGQGEVKKRIVKKPRKQVKKRMKPRTKFTLLITDPSWQGTASKGRSCLSDSSVSTTKNTAPARYNNNSESEFDADCEASVPSNVSSIRNEDSAEEAFSPGFDFEVSNDDFLGFEGETRSSFVIPSRKGSGTNESVPMISASVLPTPAISKHISKFIGGSSTPRMENIVAAVNDKEKTRTANDSIAECFGFDDESEEECELNISPVQQSRLRSTLEVTGTSDMTVGELHPATLPSRFSWSSLRPGNRSRASTSRSSSMVAQGRSVTFMTDTSHRSQTKITSFTAPTVNKQHLRPRRGKQACRDELQDTVSTETEPGDRIEAAEVSVLFDEDELMEKPSEDKEPSEASSVSKKASQAPNKSPEKSFVKAPRKSYDRTSLLEARRKFIEMHGGYDEHSRDGSSTEEDEEEDVKHKAKSRKKPSKVTKKKETKSLKIKTAEGGLKKTAASTSKKKKKKAKVYDASVDEWASRINSHFSEVDESLLMVE